jgi:hypothetical protein
MSLLSIIFAWFSKPVEAPKETITPPIVEVVREKKTVASVQFFVTKKMKMQLRDLGYTKFQIEDLTPTQAADRIRDNKGPNG